MVDRRGDLLFQPGGAREAPRVDDDAEHVVRDPILFERHRRDGPAAAHGPGEKLAQKREPVALVKPEGEDRAARLSVHDARVGARVALGVDEHPLCHLLSPVHGDANLSEGDDAGGEVEDDRRLALRRGKGDAEGVRQESRVAAAKRGDDRRVSDDVHEVDRDEPRGRCLFSVGTDAADVRSVPERHQRDPSHSGALHACGDPLPGDNLAEALPPVRGEHPPSQVLDPCVGPGVDQTGTNAAHVLRQHADSMAVVPGQVGIDEVIGDDPGIRIGGAGRNEQASGDPAKPIVWDGHHHVHE